MSEFELGVLRKRMTEAMWAKAERGELRISVPIGFIWARDGALGFDPDMRVQEAVRTIFTKFTELGSARQVHLWMTKEGLHFPRPSDGKATTSFEWRRARYRNIISVLKNPFYAGAYAYGKSEAQTEIVEGRARKSYGHRLPMGEWRVLIKEHHEGYITWDEFERNQAQFVRNTFSRRGGAAKSGRGGGSLLSGMLRCRRCGHILSVVYTGRTPTPKYRCDRLRQMYGDPWCIRFAAWPVEAAIVRVIIEAVRPMAIEAAMSAERTLVEERDEARRLRELELQQATYEARLAERRYASCDPDNRLVAAQLEARWNDCLERIARIERQLQPESAETQQVEAHELDGLADDLLAAWNAPSTTSRTRQRLVRALIEEIVVDVDEDSSEVLLTIRWSGGHHTQLTARKPKTGEHRRRTSDEAVDVIRSMAGKWSDEHIAATLNRMGFRTGQDNTWDERRVQAIRKRHDIRAYKSAAKDGEWVTMSEAASKLGVTNHVVRRLIKSGVLPARQVVARAPYQIRTSDLERLEVIEALVSRRHKGPCREPVDGRNLRIPGT